MKGISRRLNPKTTDRATEARNLSELPCGFCVDGKVSRSMVVVTSPEYTESDLHAKTIRTRVKKPNLLEVQRGICTDCYTTLGYANREANRRAAAANKKAKSRRKRALVKAQKRRVR